MLACLTFFSCSKENKQIIFTENLYEPTSVDLIKSKVAAFVATINTGNNDRNPYSDTEVNEAKWLIEASSNYLYNDNAMTGIPDTVVKYSLSIANINTSGILKMVGSEMTSQTQALLQQITETEMANNTTSCFADVELDQISTSTSQLTVKVAFKRAPQGDISWDQASSLINQGITDIIANNNGTIPTCSCWNPSVTIFEYNFIWDISSFQIPANTQHLPPFGPYFYRFEGLPHTQPYPMAQVGPDANTAVLMATQKVNQHNASNPSGSTKYLRSAGVSWSTSQISVGYLKTHYLSLVTAASGQTICYGSN
jgi:hypothetical protein